MGWLLGCALGIWASTAQAQINFNSFTAGDISDTAADKLDINGVAALNGSAIRLTPATGNQAGSMFYSTKQFVAAGFDTTFSFIWGNTASGADGTSFVIHNAAAASDALGGSGGSHGYSGITPSLILEIDGHNSGAEAQTFDGGESGGVGVQAQLSLHVNGNANEAAGLVSGSFLAGQNSAIVGSGASGSATDVSNGLAHTVRLRYTVNPGASDDVLDVFYDSTPTLSMTGAALETAFGNARDGSGQSWVGFAASTGGALQSQDIASWNFTSVPEPSAFLLLGSAAAGGLVRRRRRMGRAV